MTDAKTWDLALILVMNMDIGAVVNCEQNSLLYLVRRTTGGACHTLEPPGSSRPACYYRTVTEGLTLRHRAP